MGGISEKTAWHPRDDLFYRKLVDGGMLYDGRHRRVHHLNATAAFVWEACQKGQGTSEMVRDLCRSYDVDDGSARADVVAMLERFVSAELLQP